MAAPQRDDGAGGGWPSAAQAAFAQLRRQFQAGLPARWAEIEAAPDEAARRAALHRLAGAAASFGFPELGALARRIEQAPQASWASLLPELEVQLRAAADTVP